MVDPWELLDRAMNVESLIEAIIEASFAAYVIYKNREMLKQIAAKAARKLKVIEPPPEVRVQIKTATARLHATSSLTATGRVSREPPSALEELLAWYLRIASS